MLFRSFPSPGDLPNPGIKSRSLALQADSLPAKPQEKPKNTGVGSLSLLQQIFPTQDSNLGLPHCGLSLYQLSHKGSPRILEWVAYPFSIRFFPTQESNLGLPHCGLILYQLSHKGSPRILEWVAYPFSRGSSPPRNQTSYQGSPQR